MNVIVCNRIVVNAKVNSILTKITIQNLFGFSCFEMDFSGPLLMGPIPNVKGIVLPLLILILIVIILRITPMMAIIKIIVRSE